VAPCIIVFAKAPIPNQVKTRLLPALSPEQVASLYQAFLVDWCNVLSTIDTADLVIAYTPPESRPTLQALIGEHAIYVPQAGENLGERLITAARWASDQGYTKFLFVGSDSPTLPIEYVKHALTLLESRDVVIGPSMDGGYYLIGFSENGAKLAIPTIFEAVAWSTARVFRQTLDKIESVNAQLGLLPPWYDVDTPAELQFLSDHLLATRRAGKTIPAPLTDRQLHKYLSDSSP
jgi:rSAM/selenodomain-associated transferase 1